jgi:hypothetical protein
MSKEERLAYYAEKYGEDFGGRSAKSGGKKRKKTGAAQGVQKQNGSGGGQRDEARPTDGSKRKTRGRKPAANSQSSRSGKPAGQKNQTQKGKKPQNQGQKGSVSNGGDNAKAAKSRQPKGLFGAIKRMFGGE